ncbi:MAG TPA: EAL domain-containing protein [Methylomirabilota bacterium]|nr:EAL domain-containing protein [Methylomirabilota bacterium]
MDPVVVEFPFLSAAVRIGLATAVGFAVFLTGFRLADRSRETTLEGRAGWLFLGSVAVGSGLWACSALLLSTVTGPVGVRGNVLAAALFVAIAGAMAGFIVTGRRPGAARALVAGLAVAVATVVVVAMGLGAVTVTPALQGSPWGTVLTASALTVLVAAAHLLASRCGGHRGPILAAAVMAPAVALSAMAQIVSAGFAGGLPPMPDGDTIGSDAVGITVAVVVFLVVGTGMATALIHRDAEFTSQRRLKRLADASIEGLAILRDNRIVEVNEALVRLFGRGGESLRGEIFVGGLVTGDGLDEEHGADRIREAFLTVGEGRSVPVEIVARSIDFDNRPHTVYAIRDLSDRRDAELRIRFLAEHDVLTGLPNRAAFQRELEKACAGRADGGGAFALFCVDLDRFKEANDVFGHLAGDDVLIQVSERLRSILPDNGVVARLGGDEFALLAPDLGVHASADLAEVIVSTLAAPVLHENQRIGIGASVGVALAPADGETPDLLLARADMALNRAKGQGGGISCFFEVAMDEETRTRRALAFELRDAIAEGQLELAYQPLADLSSSGVTGFEALVRWNHPVHGAIAPTIFVAIAEESGFISQLGEWVLRTAAAEAAGWRRPLTVAVNLSPLQLEQQHLPELVHEILLQTGLSPTRLELEVTETALMRNPQRSLDVLRRLKAMGVRIAMDDFGTGYSSLSTLRSFPFDKLKIDRSFVDRLGSHGQTASIVRAVVGLSRSLDIRVVAEGVETEAQIAFLTGESCDEVQGFMIGLPLPIARYAHLTQADGFPPAPGRSTTSEAA